MALTSIRRWQIEPLKWILKKITGVTTQLVDIQVNAVDYPTVEFVDTENAVWTVEEVSPSETKISVEVTGGTGGDSAYVYIAYASDASGTGFTNTFNAALDYIAIKESAVEIVSPAASDFTGLWKNYKGSPGEKGDAGAAGLDSADIFDVYIDFLALTPFVYTCPYAMEINSQISEGTDATLSPVATTHMAQFEDLTVTPTQLGLIILKGALL